MSEEQKTQNTQTSTCSGHCCRAFQIGGRTYESLKSEYEAWLENEKNGGSVTGMSMRAGLERRYERLQLQTHHEIHIIFPMLIPLGKLKHNPEKLINTHEENAGETGVDFYSCKHLSKEGLCTIYDIRPQMCRSYGMGQTCEYEECTWEGHKEQKRHPLRKYSEGEQRTIGKLPIIQSDSYEKAMVEKTLG
jgi:Fe-S-cluster containining protein